MAADIEQGNVVRDVAGHTISIRRSLVRSVCALLILLAGVFFGSTIITGRQMRESMSAALIDRAVNRVQSDVEGFIAPVERSLVFISDLLADGVIDPDDIDGLNRLFVPLIREIPQISSVNLGDAEGRGFLLLRLDGRWRNRLSWTDSWGDRLDFREWDPGADPEAGAAPPREWTVLEPEEADRYDPRTRDWYRVIAEREVDADEDARVHWTAAYRFFTTGEPGISASISVVDRNGHPWVLAFDVLLRDLSHFTQRLHVSPDGIGFVLDSENRLLGLPSLPQLMEEPARGEALLERPELLGIPLLDAGQQRIAEIRPEPTQIFSFESEGDTYWTRAATFPLGANQSVLVVAAVPERDLLGPVSQQRIYLGAAALVGLGLAVLLAFWLARRYAMPLVALAQNSERIGSLELEGIAPVASELTEVQQLATEQERMRVALDSFSRYVPTEIVRELMNRGVAARIGGEHREVTALFTDVRSYTTIAESLDAEALTAHMAEYFEELLDTVQSDGYGTVTQLAGDGIVALWGAPVDDGEHARNAARAVLRCQARLRALEPKWRARGLPPLPTRFGLASGPAVIGNVGSPSRLVYTAIGDTMNLASRLEGLGRFYGVSAMAAETTRRASDDLLWRRVDVVRVKGKDEAVAVYELLGESGGVDDARLDFARSYEEALAAYTRGDFDAAVAGLEGLYRSMPDDLSVVRLLELSRRFATVPPRPGWDGVSEFEVK